ncbi:hypothetical protein PybrP1_011013 [[Pythium] brassicae (nom. inval.)]|nr:hypothetical protein PybrP1_011013 [[Pythium] brassicae (nom. inval.)]
MSPPRLHDVQIVTTDDASERPLPHDQRRPKRRNLSVAATRGKHSIHLESAPWLGFERASHAHREPSTSAATSAQAPPRGSSAQRQQRGSQQLPPPHDRRDHASRATKGSSRERTQASLQSTAGSANSVLSESTRSMLDRKAMQISHALVRRASQLVKSAERSRALAAGSRRSRSLEIEGYRFLHLSKSGVAVYEDATAIRLEHRASAQPRYIGVAVVRATIDEFVDTFGRPSEQGFAQLNPDMTAFRDVHAVCEAPDRRASVKWMAMQPAWTGSLARRRDFVVLECDEVFATDSGSGVTRRGWVQAMHSVQLPWCAPGERAASIVRGSLYQSGTVAIESATSPEWLHVVSAVEIDMKGTMTDRAQRANALRRIAGLETVAAALMRQRVQRMSMLRTKPFQAARSAKEAHCAVCTQRIGLPSLRLHHYCRKCTASVCGSCSRSWQLDPASKKKTRVCGVCIAATRPSQVPGSSSWIDAAANADGATQHAPSLSGRRAARQSGAQSLSEGLPSHGGIDNSRADPNLQSAPQNSGRLPTTQRRTSRRYYDLPMDASELGPLSDDDDDDDGNDDACDADGPGFASETIYHFGDAGALSMCDVAHRVSSAEQPTLAARSSEHVGAKAWEGARASATRTSQTVTEEDDDDEDECYDSELGFSVGPSFVPRSAGAPSRGASTAQKQETYERDQLIHL